MFQSDGYVYVVAAAVLAALAFATALRLRSWTWWLAAFALTVGTLCVAWSIRTPVVPSVQSPSVSPPLAQASA